MRILVSTKETQGRRKNDFCWVPEGEPVTFGGLECDGETVDGHCGCKRSLSGINCRTATTTFKVVESELTKEELYSSTIKANADWVRRLPDLQDGFKQDIDETLRIANSFPVGTVLEKRGNKICNRRFK